MTGFALLVTATVFILGEPTVEDDWRALDYSPADRTALVERSKRAPYASIGPVVLKFVDLGPTAYGSSFSDEPWNNEGLPARDRKWWMALTVWKHHFQGNDRDDPAKAKFLIAQLQKASGQTEKLYLISDLQHYHWHPDAQAALLKLAQNAAEDFKVRNNAAQTLLCKFDPNVHLQSALQVATSYGDFPRRCEAFNRIFNIGNGLLALTPENQRLLLLAGFEMLDELPEGGHRTGYFVARRLGGILKIEGEFTPDRNLPRYKDAAKFKEVYFPDTTRNALKWYAEHKAELQKAPPAAVGK